MILSYALKQLVEAGANFSTNSTAPIILEESDTGFKHKGRLQQRKGTFMQGNITYKKNHHFPYRI